MTDGEFDLSVWLARILFIALILRWGYAFVRTLDKAATWEPARHQVWPMRLRRDGYRVLLLTTVLIALVGLVWSFLW